MEGMKMCMLEMFCFVFRVILSVFISFIWDVKSVMGFKFDCLICFCVFCVFNFVYFIYGVD